MDDLGCEENVVLLEENISIRQSAVSAEFLRLWDASAKRPTGWINMSIAQKRRGVAAPIINFPFQERFR